MIDKKKEEAADNYIVQRSNFLPQLAAFGKYEIFQSYLSSLEPKWVIGLQFKLNIFNGLRDYTKLQTAIHMEREVDYAAQEAEKKVSLWVNKSYRDVQNSSVRYNKLNATIELANENLRANEKRFESGMGTSLEVIDARLMLEKNQVERLVSLHDYYRSLTDLYLATGRPQEILNIWKSKEK
jgi:outer membrane protein TolC